MKLFAVLGRPVSHSLSPEMHRAAYRALGIDAEYIRIDCATEELPRIAELARAGVLAGVNITVPHKVAAFELADDADDEARLLGAANTWVLAGGKLVAHNTDGPGFLWGLARGSEVGGRKSEIGGRKSETGSRKSEIGGGESGVGNRELEAGSRNVEAAEAERKAGDGGSAIAAHPSGAISDFRFPISDTPRALILGAGGAARAICLALTRRGWNVTLATLKEELPRAVEVFLPLGGLVIEWEGTAFEALAPQVDLLVNATPLGMTPNVRTLPDFPLSRLKGTTIVYDIVYNPCQTLFLTQAASIGLLAIGGTSMLVGQGACSFELWLGTPAPALAMLNALEAALDSSQRGESANL